MWWYFICYCNFYYCILISRKRAHRHDHSLIYASNNWILGRKYVCVCVWGALVLYALAVAERPKSSEELQLSHSKMLLPLLFDSSLFYYSFYLSAWYLDCCAVQYLFASRLTSWLVVWCPLIPKNRTSFSHFSERILHTPYASYMQW